MGLFHFNFAYLLPLTEDGIQQNLLIFIIDMILFFFLIHYSLNEVRQIYKIRFKKYFRSIFNWLDIVLIILVDVSVCFNIYQMIYYEGESHQYKIVNSFASFLYWHRLASFYRGFMSTGFFVRLIIKVCY